MEYSNTTRPTNWKTILAELDWAGTGPKPIKRADTSLSTFRELLNEREAEEKKRRMKQSIEQKRAQKYQKNGHSHEE